MIARYTGKTRCPVCHGTRLKKEASYVKINGRSITELVDIPISELKTYFDNPQLSEHDQTIAARVLPDIHNRIDFLLDVGLGYLTLNRLSSLVIRWRVTTHQPSNLFGFCSCRFAIYFG